MKSLNKNIIKYFSSASHTAKKATPSFNISENFHNTYIKEMERLKAANKSATENSFKVKESSEPLEAYKNPYHSEKFPVYWSTHNIIKDSDAAYGTEQVSPHYESFAVSRRPVFIGGLFLIGAGWLEQLNLSSYYGAQATYELYSLFILMIGINESRYILQKLPMPRLTWYYDAFVQHEFKQALLNWFDTAEDISRQVLVKTKNQIDYYFIHQEYNFVKKRLLSTYLENERLALNGHLKERALNILKVANTMENSNVKSAISKAAEESLNSVIEQVKNPSKNKEILKSSFESALIGLKTGYMEYQGDKVVPLYVKELNERTSKLSNLSPEEEDKLFALNESQKKQLMSLDKAAKNAYLGKLPEINASLRNTDVYQNVAKRIKAKL